MRKAMRILTVSALVLAFATASAPGIVRAEERVIEHEETIETARPVVSDPIIQ